MVVIFIVFIHLEQKTNVNHVKKNEKIKDFFSLVMPSGDTKILVFNQHCRFDIINVYLESLLEK